MMKKALLASLVVSSFMASVHAAPGVYAGLSAGIGGMNTKNYSTNNNPFNSVSLRDGVAYRAALGYLMGESELNYGLELGYTGYPKNTYKGAGLVDTYTGHYVDLLGVGKYNFNSGFYVVGKAGAALVSQRVQANLNGSNAYNKTTRSVKPELALGAGYNVNQNVAVDATFSHVFGGQANPGSSNSAATRVSAVNTLMAGISYNFS